MSHVDKPLHERIIDWAVQTEEGDCPGDPFGIVSNESEEWFAMERCRGVRGDGGVISFMSASGDGYSVLVLLMIAAIAEAGDLP